MPNPRLHFDINGVVLSKTTEDATNLALPDVDKIFDSNWLFGLQVLGSGVWSFAQGVTSGTFTFPDYGFQPALLLRAKARPPYRANSGGGGLIFYSYEETTARTTNLAFTNTNNLGGRFLSNTSVSITHGDSFSAVEVHWMAINL